MRVYIAGPYSSAPLENTQAAICVAEQIASQRCTVMVPHLNYSWDNLYKHSHDFWLNNDLGWLAVADCMVVLPGESRGVEIEKNFANENGIPWREWPCMTWLHEIYSEIASKKRKRMDEAIEHASIGLRVSADHTATESVCQEAHRLTNGERNDSYGHPLDDWTHAARIISGILQYEVTPEQVGKIMIGVKLARESHKHKRDNLVDIAGYANAIQMLHDERSRRSR